MRRRDFLPLIPFGAAGIPALAQKARLKIRDVRVVNFRLVREVGSMEPAWNPGGTMDFRIGGGSYTEIRTEQGLIGIGPGMDPSLAGAANAQLKGRDPFDTEQHAGRLRYYVRGPAYRGAAGLDIALWDLVGKASGQPLYKIWGGAKDQVVPYASMVRLGTPEERARLAAELSAAGWKAIKLRLHHESIKDDVRTVEEVRKAVGDRMEIMVDANQAQSAGDWQPGIRWDFARALQTAKELERLGVYWLEEPLPRYAFDQLAELNRRVEVPLAGGENNIGIHEFVWMLRDGVYDILQPEGMVMNGCTDLLKIGALAKVHNKRIVPHHGGRDIGTIAHLHLVAAWTHAPYFEMLHDPPVGDYRHQFAIFKNPPLVG
jgi:L-alanine-DL-glutamate epimerase-like enolase superfamily enzyme